MKGRAVVGGLFALLMVGAVGGAAYYFLAPKKQAKVTPGVAPIVPGVNPNVNYDLPAINVQIGTGYQDVRFEDVIVDTTHLDGFWQYQGGVR